MSKSEDNRILAEMHETASGLHRLGFIDKRRMNKYDELCLEPIQPFGSEEVRALRQRLEVSQAVLAHALNISISAVRKWEAGEKSPNGPSLKLLNILDRKGLEAIR